ncbi:hypothetical protein NEOKW01_2018, partial [Nematocida sp. AWRm80]
KIYYKTLLPAQSVVILPDLDLPQEKETSENQGTQEPEKKTMSIQYGNLINILKCIDDQHSLGISHISEIKTGNNVETPFVLSVPILYFNALEQDLSKSLPAIFEFQNVQTLGITPHSSLISLNVLDSIKNTNISSLVFVGSNTRALSTHALNTKKSVEHLHINIPVYIDETTMKDIYSAFASLSVKSLTITIGHLFIPVQETSNIHRTISPSKPLITSKSHTELKPQQKVSSGITSEAPGESEAAKLSLSQKTAQPTQEEYKISSLSSIHFNVEVLYNSTHDTAKTYLLDQLEHLNIEGSYITAVEIESIQTRHPIELSKEHLSKSKSSTLFLKPQPHKTLSTSTQKLFKSDTEYTKATAEKRHSLSSAQGSVVQPPLII